MMNSFIRPLLFALLFFSSFSFLSANNGKIDEEARFFHESGEQTDDYWKRLRAFNRSLKLLLLLESQNHPSSSIEKAVADTYFQLEAYPYAALHYEKSLKIDPSNKPALDFLIKTREKLGLIPPFETSTFFTRLMALANNFHLLFLSILTVFIAASFAIWAPSSWKQRSSSMRRILFTGYGVAIFFPLFFLTIHLIAYYNTPLEGVLIQSSSIYLSPGKDLAQLTKAPLLAGSKVFILSMSHDRQWVKIKNEDGMIGYIHTCVLRSI